MKDKNSQLFRSAIQDRWDKPQKSKSYLNSCRGKKSRGEKREHKKSRKWYSTIYARSIKHMFWTCF